MTIFKKRPVCWMAIGFLLILCVLLVGRSYKEVSYRQEYDCILVEGTVVNKEYKDSAYGGYWGITLKKVRIGRKNQEGRKGENTNLTKPLEGRYLCRLSTQHKTGAEEKKNPMMEKIKIGQKIVVEGDYAPWEEATNPGQFDLGRYYVSQGILGQFQKCSVIKTGTEYSEILEGMWQFRQNAQALLVQKLGEQDGGLISAMLLGEKSGLMEEDKSLYQRNGISHILAISGLHLTLLGMGVFRELKRILPDRNSASAVSIVAMILYCVFTGNSISTIRATIMFTMSLLAEMLGKSYDSLSALGLAAILQLFWNPYVVNNSGFLLSFLAVLGVTFLAPRLQLLFHVKSNMAKSLCVSLSASLATLPVLLINYGVFPWYSIFLNLCILPFLSVLLFLAIILLGMNLWTYPMIEVLGENLWKITSNDSLCVLKNVAEGLDNGVVKCIRMCLQYFQFCCDFFEKLFAWDRYLGAPGGLQIFLYGLLILIAVSSLVTYSPLARKMLLLAAVSILTLRFQPGAEITMLDVGQGDSVVIRNGNGNVYISDCGSSSVSKVGKYRLIPFLRYKGYGRIKGIFLSHLDNDHMNGIVELLELAGKENISISYLFLPESVCFVEEDREILDTLLLLAEKNGVKTVFLKRGDYLIDGRMEFYCIHPQTAQELVKAKQDRNNRSMVLLMKYQNLNMVLTGDVEEEGEKEILNYLNQMSQSGKDSMESFFRGKKHKKGAENVMVLKVAHHGSSGSGCEEFLEMVTPNLAVISCGQNNSYGHPHKETLERLKKSGSKILITTETGAITMKPAGKRWKAETYR